MAIWERFGVHTGSWGLPEFGVTEALAKEASGEQTTDLSQAISGDYQPMAQQPSGGGGAGGGGGGAGGGEPVTTGGEPTGDTGGGGGGGGGPSAPDLTNPAKRTEYAHSRGYDSWEQMIQAQQEPEPSQPSFEETYGPAFEKAFAAMNQYKGTLRPRYETTISEIESRRGQQKRETERERASRLGEYQSQRERESTRAQNTIAEARRLASQLQQGIQARFGGSTSAGPAYSEILGAQATRNIGRQRQALAQVTSQISRAEDEVKNRTSDLMQKIEDNTGLAKRRAKDKLQSSLAEVARMKGELGVQKADRKLQLLQGYRNELQGIRARNAQFKQDLFKQAYAAEQELEQLKAQATSNYSGQFTPPEYNIGGQKVYGLPSRGVRYYTPDEEGQGVYKIPTRPTETEDDLANPYS